MSAYDAVLFSPPAPLARVVLQNPASGVLVSDVPMLLDSGADVTLVPEDYVVRLGMPVDPDERYGLAAFDGSTSTAQVVHLQMVFLGRTFRGRFLLTNHPCGILGRNVLNTLCLVLDGPGLAWHEASS